MFAQLPISEKQQNGKVLSESLVETVVHDWADLGNAREMGEEIHATYRREMEATYGPDHITTIPEDYAQHVILGVHLVMLSTQPPSFSAFLLTTRFLPPIVIFSRPSICFDWLLNWSPAR